MVCSAARFAAGALCMVLMASAGAAELYPSKTVRIVVPRAQDKRLAVSTEIAQDIVINADRRGLTLLFLTVCVFGEVSST